MMHIHQRILVLKTLVFLLKDLYPKKFTNISQKERPKTPNIDAICIDKWLLAKHRPTGFQVKPLRKNNLDHSKNVQKEVKAKISLYFNTLEEGIKKQSKPNCIPKSNANIRYTTIMKLPT